MRHLLLSLFLLAAAPAAAADLAANVGVLEVLVLPGPQHAGLYPYLGASAAFPVKSVVVIPGLAVEWSPEFGRGGLVASVVVDWPVLDHLGLDVDVALIHDQPGLDFGASLFYLGGGVGCSVFVEKWTFSPYLNVFAGLSEPGVSLVPGLNIARTF